MPPVTSPRASRVDSGTYLAIGVLAGITVLRVQATRQRGAPERDRSH